MSKYYKADDVINAIEDKIAEYIPTLYGRYNEIPLELRMAIEHLPTIEVSEATAIRIVENECFRDDLSQEIKDYLFSDLRHKLYHEQVEVSEDCISRAAAIEVLSHVKKDEQWRTECIDNEIRLIKLLPSVAPTTEQSSKVGEWIEVDDESILFTVYKCSRCGKVHASSPHNYCPNCGADMRGVSNDD